MKIKRVKNNEYNSKEDQSWMTYIYDLQLLQLL